MKINTYQTEAAQNKAWYSAIKEQQKKNEARHDALTIITAVVVVVAFISLVFIQY